MLFKASHKVLHIECFGSLVAPIPLFFMSLIRLHTLVLLSYHFLCRMEYEGIVCKWGMKELFVYGV